MLTARFNAPLLFPNEPVRMVAYIVFELLDGGDLFTWVRGSRFSEAVCRKLFK